MTSTFNRTNSAAISAARELRPSAQRYSITTVRPSVQPRSRSRCTKAATHWLMAKGVLEPNNPIVGSFAACCARAASGEAAAAAPPSSVMNSRRFMCGWPRLARDHLACSAEVACSHVSGLLVQSEWTAGPDGVREPSPHHSNGIDVPMKRQVWLGCVGIDRLCHHASLLSRKLQNVARGPNRRGHALVVLMPVHHRPGDARGLIG